MTYTDTAVRTDLVTFARLGMDEQAGSFQSNVPNWETFAAIMATLRGENEFSPRRVGATFRELFDEASQVEIGHEGNGPAIWVHLPWFPNQRKAGARPGEANEKLTAEQRIELARRVVTWGKSMKADSVIAYQKGYLHACVVGASTAEHKVGNAPGDAPTVLRIFWG
jgi:hypothetical protein